MIRKDLIISIVGVILSFVILYYILDLSISDIIWIFIALFIHELGHYFAMKYFKYDKVRLYFVPFLGALTRGIKNPMSQKEFSFIILAGPMPGLIIGILLFALSRITNYSPLGETAFIFVIINLINLIPVFPLDGGQFIKTMFFPNKVYAHCILSLFSLVIVTSIAFSIPNYLLLFLTIFLIAHTLYLFIELRKQNQSSRPKDQNTINIDLKSPVKFALIGMYLLAITGSIYWIWPY